MAEKLSKTINEMLAVIPLGELALRADLKRKMETALYASPERIVELRREVRHILNYYIPKLYEGWHLEVTKVFSE